MRTLILCGGKGTRAYPHTQELPKPLLEVAGRPILGHVMEIYARQGFCDFVLAAGFMVHMIEQFAAGLSPSWSVEVVDTGEDANTGDRVRACAPRMGERYFLTYADGLGDVDLHALAQFHDDHGGAATMTSVPLPSQYGTVQFVGDRVTSFLEKPRLPDHWINAGFFVLDDRAEKWLAGADFEREVLPTLAGAGELFAFRHSGFWRSMDTYKDALDLTSLCADGPPPWTGPVTASVPR
ncbi:MAG TPA: nucleotidyl transferase [Acidimicrobiaceae bacterium]|nr:nucleotidyl transferase [Acidimicrobiaceae bacterium]